MKIIKLAEMAQRAIGKGPQTSDDTILRQAIIAEQDAINLYEQFARSTSNKKLKKILLDVAREEKVHVIEFETLLNKIDKEQKGVIEEGQKEAKELLK